jgi:hypothetical protein
MNNGKVVLQNSNGVPIRVRVEGAHPPTNVPAHLKNPFHEVPHVHIEYRQNVLTGAWGKGLNNTFTLPQSWFR